jgi:hypothetical protein
MMLFAPTAGHGNAMLVPIMATSVHQAEQLRSDVPDCIGQTGTLKPPQTLLAASRIGREPVEGAKPTVQAELLTIVLRVRDTATVPDDVLTKAQADVTRIYREAGVQVLWSTPDLLSAESNALRQAALTVAILTINQANRINSGIAEDRVGFAARAANGDGRLVYVIYDRVERLTGGNGVRRASMLAFAIAHEIGHLLLPSNAHSHIGIMRAEWARADLQLAQRELTFFTPRQAEQVRNRIASAYRVAGKDIQKYLCDGRLSLK